MSRRGAPPGGAHARRSGRRARAPVGAAVAADPSDADALAALALHHLARGQLGAASLVCARVDEAHAQAAHDCALVAARAGDLHLAERRLRASLAADADGPAVITLAELLSMTYRYAEALPLHHRAYLSAPDDYDAVVSLGVALVRTACIDQARAAYRRATELDPERPEAWYDLGLLFQYGFGDAQQLESVAAFHRFLELAEDRPELAALARSVRDEECVRERRETSRRSWRIQHCEPGYLVRLYRDAMHPQELRELSRLITRQHRAIETRAALEPPPVAREEGGATDACAAYAIVE